MSALQQSRIALKCFIENTEESWESMKKGIAGIQWMIFMIAAAIVAPISIANQYHLTTTETSGLLARTIFVLGIAGILQIIIGHKLPIHEGPAGLWWSVFTVYTGYIGVLYSTNIAALQALSGAMIVSGGFFIILSFFGFIEKLAKLFTPTVTFIYLMLLVLQLSGSFIKGMFGITGENGTINVKTALLSLVVVCLSFFFGKTRILWVRQYSVVFSLLIGWLLFIVFRQAPAVAHTSSWFALPELFPFGAPLFDLGGITTAFFLTFLLITNLVASIRLMETIINPSGAEDSSRYRRSGFVSGFNQLLGGGFGAIGSVPISGAAGFVAQTGEKSRLAFLIGCVLTTVITFFPPLMHVMAAIPAPVGYAVVFVLFSNMVVMALKELKNIIRLENDTYLIIGISLMTGVGIMFLPPSATSQLPAALIALLNNGLIVGSVIGILLEQLLLYRNRTQK